MLDLGFIHDNVRMESASRNSSNSMIIRPEDVVTHADGTSYYFSGVGANQHVRQKGDIVILGEVGPNATVESEEGGITVLQIEKGYLVTGSIEPNTLMRARENIVLCGAGANSEVTSTEAEIHAYKKYFGPAPVRTLTTEFAVTRPSGFAHNARAFAYGNIHTTRQNDRMVPDRASKTEEDFEGVCICQSKEGIIVIVGDEDPPQKRRERIKLPTRAPA